MSKNLNSRDIYLFGGVQSAKDSAATLTATSVLLTQNLNAQPLQGNRGDIQYDGDGGLNVSSMITQKYNMYSWDSWSVGSGSAGTAPTAGPFLRGCGLDETIAGGVSVTYSRVTDLSTKEYLTLEHRQYESASAHYLKRSVNAIGQVGLILNAGERARWQFQNVMGDYVQPSRVASWTAPDYGTPSQKDQVALEVNSANVPTATFDSDALCVSQFSIPNLSGYTVTRNDEPNCDDCILTSGVVEGSITFRQTDWATEFNPYAYSEDDTGYAFSYVLGTSAGNILTMSSSDAQIFVSGETAVNGLSYGQATIRFRDGLTLVYT